MTAPNFPTLGLPASALRPRYGLGGHPAELQGGVPPREQNQQAAMDDAFAELIDQVAGAHAATEQTAPGQQAGEPPTFDPVLTLIAIAGVLLSFTKSAFAIAWEFMQVVVFSCRLSTAADEKVRALSSYLAPTSLHVWAGYTTIICSVLLFHLLDALLLRWIFFPAMSAKDRVAASAATFLWLGRGLKKFLASLLMPTYGTYW